MNYAKVENEQVMQIGLPTTGILTQAGFEGCSISGYDKLPYTSENPEEPTLHKEGWLPVIDNPPEYEPENQYLEHAGYTLGETEVLVNYVIKQIQPVIAVPTAEERLAAIEEALLMII
jgi:hypothetical protein